MTSIPSKKIVNKKNAQPLVDKKSKSDIVVDAQTIKDGTVDLTKKEGIKTKSSAHNKIQEISNKALLSSSQIVALIVGIIAISATLWTSFVYIPYINDQTDESKAAKQKKEEEEKKFREKSEKQSKLASEASSIKLNETDIWNVNMQIKVGDNDSQNIIFTMDKSYAPATVENFIRLSYRGFYNGLIFHRMVKEKDFVVLQGGDPKGDGTGGETASGDPVPDELWLEKPVYDISNQQSKKITNEPKFRSPSLYTNFNKDTGVVTYRKGLILMAKTQAVDSATSQFFITLDNTILPAEYTVFGIVKDESMGVIENLAKNLNPVTQEGSQTTPPNKKVIIEKVSI